MLFLGGSLLQLWYNIPRNPILFIKAPKLLLLTPKAEILVLRSLLTHEREVFCCICIRPYTL